MSSAHSQQGFVLSLGLHVSVAVIVAVLAWVQPRQNPAPTVFELIPLGTPGPASATEAEHAEVKLANPPPARPTTLSPPTPRPTPPRAAPIPSAPRPQTKPAPPRKDPPPASKPAPAPAPAERLSYQDFLQQHGQPQTRAPRTPAPTRTPTKAPRIDTHFTSTVSGANRIAGSVSGSPDADRTEVTLYLANLFDAIERAWEKPTGLELTVAVDIDIAPGGRISNVRISRSSGNAAYDESALAAVRAVGSIGPTPGGQTLLRTLRFNMKPQ